MLYKFINFFFIKIEINRLINKKLIKKTLIFYMHKQWGNPANYIFIYLI